MSLQDKINDVVNKVKSHETKPFYVIRERRIREVYKVEALTREDAIDIIKDSIKRDDIIPKDIYTDYDEVYCDDANL